MDYFNRRLETLGSGLAILWILACGGAVPAASQPMEPTPTLPSSEPWARVLDAHYRDGGLDYAGLAADRTDLDAYLAALAGAEVAGAPREELIAFWSNAYNAVVAHFVLERYPEIRSVKDVDGFFDRLTYEVAGERLTLDQIEARGRDEGDPRVHFAVVCASHSCPDLRPEPYVADRVEQQLQEQTLAFLNDAEKGMRLDRETGQLWLSSIFMWYADDFTGGSRMVAFFARGRVLDWVLSQLPEETAEEIRQLEPSVRYLDYDWSLNDRQ